MTKLMLILMLLAGGADLASTEYAISRGAIEVNPLMKNKAVRLVSTVAMPVAAYFMFRDMPKVAKWFTVFYVGYKVFKDI